MSASFTFLAPLAGGALIGAASVVLLALVGRIAGVSGILHDLFRPPAGEMRWRIAFIAGLVLSGFAVLAIAPEFAPHTVVSPLPRVAIAGVLVGVGTRMANGCTSGHGVCGLGRLSPRSLVAVLVFLAAAIVTTSVLRHGFGVQP